MKFLNDVATFLRIKRKRKENRSEEDENISASAFTEEDQNPGNVSLTDGEHDKPFVINNKIVKGIALCTVFLLLFVFFVKQQQTTKNDSPNKDLDIAQEAADPARVQITNKEAASYDVLLATNRHASGVGGGAPGPIMSNGNSIQAEEQSQIDQKLPGIGITESPVPAAPVIPASPYPFPYTPPVTQPDSSVSEEQQSKEKRLKSAISFGIGTQNADGVSKVNPNEQGNAENTNQNAGKLTYTAPGKNVLQAGTLIPVMLFSGINTDAPGQVTAQVAQDVYDSATATNLLIPAGSKLLGSYDGSNAASGRVNITFSLLVLPDGGSYALGESLVAVDGKGYNGVAGKINRHTGSVISGGMLSSAIAALGSYAAGNTSVTANTYSAGQLATQGAVANLMNTASQLFKDSTKRQATVTIEPGYEFNVYVVAPVIF